MHLRHIFKQLFTTLEKFANPLSSYPMSNLSRKNWTDSSWCCVVPGPLHSPSSLPAKTSSTWSSASKEDTFIPYPAFFACRIMDAEIRTIVIDIAHGRYRCCIYWCCQSSNNGEVKPKTHRLWGWDGIWVQVDLPVKESQDSKKTASFYALNIVIMVSQTIFSNSWYRNAGRPPPI